MEANRQTEMFAYDLSLKERMNLKGAGGYPATPGSAGTDKTCGDCNHYKSVSYHGKRYRKCAVIEHRWTHGSGTDIKKSAPACRFFNYEKTDDRT